MKYDVERPRKLVDRNRVPLVGIEESEGGGLRLGALVTNAQTAYDPLVQQRYAVLSSARFLREPARSCATRQRTAGT